MACIIEQTIIFLVVGGATQIAATVGVEWTIAGNRKDMWKPVKRYLETTAELLKPMSAEETAAAKNIRHIVVPLGPYRNLTTQTAAIFALHPNAIVLNHAGRRIFPRRSLNWVRKPEPQRLDQFIRAAVRLCQGGQRGDYGGSILLSHAFQNVEVRAAYQRRFQDKIIKNSVSVLYWKESMRVTNCLINGQNIRDVLVYLPNVLFLVPVRNPIDCAKSNVRTAKWQHITDERRFEKVLDRIIELYAWIWSVRADYENRFLFLWEHETSEEKLRSLARFAHLSHDPVWISDVTTALGVRKRWQTNEEIKEFERCVLGRTNQGSELQDQLLKFITPK